MIHHDSRPLDEAVQGVRDKLEAQIEQGRNQAVALFNRLETEKIEDYIIPSGEMIIRTRTDHDGKFSHLSLDVTEDRSGSMPDIDLDLHDNATSQLYTKLNFPSRYADTLTGFQEEWALELLEDNLNRLLYGNPTRFLVRSINGQARAVLSDRYRRLDARPILEKVMKSVQPYGAVPIGAVNTDLRGGIKLALPRVFEPIPDEPFLIFLEILWSDFGVGKIRISDGIDRCFCTNLAVISEIFGQVHLGKQMPENVELSHETYRLDTEWVTSAVKDVAQHIFSEKNVDKLITTLKTANDRKLDGETFATLLKRLGATKDETKKAREYFEGPIVHVLPEGNTAWRASNCISLLAKSAKGDRAVELETMAGKLIEPKDQLAVAA